MRGRRFNKRRRVKKKSHLYSSLDNLKSGHFFDRIYDFCPLLGCLCEL